MAQATGLNLSNHVCECRTQVYSILYYMYVQSRTHTHTPTSIHVFIQRETNVRTQIVDIIILKYMSCDTPVAQKSFYHSGVARAQIRYCVDTLCTDDT